MNKLRVEKKNVYEIEVNDQGETISFNIEDPSLPLRMEKAFEDIQKISDRCKKELLLIEKKPDKKNKGSLMSNNERENLKLYQKMFKDMRAAMDVFLGEGACQKIFGSEDYLSMYDELFEALKPHFEKIGLNSQSFKKSIESKYGSQDEDVLE